MTPILMHGGGEPNLGRGAAKGRARPFPANQTVIQQNPPNLQLDLVFG